MNVRLNNEAGVFHRDCAVVRHAHLVCLCTDLDGGPWEAEISGYACGQCATCGKVRSWLTSQEQNDPRYPGLHSDRLLASVPRGVRDKHLVETVGSMWDEYRSVPS